MSKPRFQFEPSHLRSLRLQKRVSGKEQARRMRISPAQVHRLENGDRRLTVETLIQYCEALDLSIGQLFAPNTWVPITGNIDSDFEIRAVQPDTPERILAPPLAGDMSRVAALRWSASRRFQPMQNHVVYYVRHDDGVPDNAWDKRCLIVRKDGSQCLGWPVQQDDSAYINMGTGPAEFNVEIVWASPVIAVMPPFAVENLQPPD